MIDVLDPDALTGFRRGPYRYSAEDGRYYLLSADGAIPADGPRLLTVLDEGQLSRVGSDHFTLRDGLIDAEPPASPAPVGEYALEGQMFGFHFPGAIGLAGPTGVTRLHSRLNLDFLAGEALDPRITFTRPSGATRVNAAGLIELAGNNVPRFDYDPVTHEPRGLLFGLQWKNLFTYSGDFTNPVWLFAGGSRSRTVIAPDGTISGTALRGPSTGPARSSSIPAPSTTVTCSIYSKWLSGLTTRQFLLRNITTGTNFAFGTMNFTTGQITGAGWTATNIGNGWFRLSFTQSTGITAGDTLSMYFGAPDVLASNDGEWAVWGAQLEAGPYATPYIPTVASQATSEADTAAMTGTNFSDWFNPAEGTFVVEADCMGSAGPSGTLLSVDAGAGIDNRLLIYKSSNSGNLSVYAGASSALVGVITSNTVIRVGLRYSADTVAGCLNGGNVASIVKPAMTSLFQLRLLGWSGRHRRLRYVPRAVSDAEFKALTAL